MILFVVLACALLMVQIDVIESVTNGELQQDIIEVELGKNGTLRFTDHVRMEGYFLSGWEIRGPYKTMQCEKSRSQSFNRRGKYIQECVAETNSSLTVIVREFKYYHAGKWTVRWEYRGNEHQAITEISTETSFSVRGIKYDNTYHGKSFKMKDGEYFVMLFEETFPEYSICRLVKEETNAIYDLNTQSHMNISSKAHIQWLDPCGFRMHLGKTSHGNWSLIGRFGWIEKRANFVVSIESSTIRLPPETKRLLGLDGFSQRFYQSGQYTELETPEGNVIRASGGYMSMSSLTPSPNGIWIYRMMGKSQSNLQEFYYSITVVDLPRVSHKLERVDDRLYNLNVSVSPYCGFRIKLEKKDGTIFWGNENEDSYDCSIRKDISCVSGCETICGQQRRYVIRNLELSDFREKMLVSFACDDLLTEAIIIVDPHSFQESIQYSSHIWYPVQGKKYVTQHENLEVKCITSAPLTNCTLKSPRNETYIPDYQSVITSKNCSGIGGICGCVAIIENVTDIHTGNWTCNMIFEDGVKVESLVPVQVLESYLIPEIVIPFEKMIDLSLHCELSPMYAYRKIKSCEWFGPDGVRINEKNWEEYFTWKNKHRCTLGFIGSGTEHSGLWKCIARLDGYPEEEIYATLNVSKQLLSVFKEKDIQPYSRNEGWPILISRGEVIFEDDGAPHFEMRIFLLGNTGSGFCTVINQKGKFFDASRRVDDKYPGWSFPLVISIEPEDEATQKWEVYLENQKGIFAVTDVSLDYSYGDRKEHLIHFWHDVPKMSVLKRGSRLENKYRANEKLQSCTLESPNHVKYPNQIIHSDDDVKVVIDEGGFCCSIIIMPQYLTKKHSGNWFLEMKTESGLESRNRLPIQVIESYIVLEAERGIYLNGTIKLHCRRRTIMYDVEIRNCKWFRPDGHQISTNESMNYNTIEKYDVCTLELSDPRDNDFGTWKCSAGVDGFSDEEIAILDLSPTSITRNKHFIKQEIGMDNESNMENSKLHMMIGDAAELICIASISSFQDRIEWRYNNAVEIIPPGRIEINELPKTTTHYRSMLSINPTLKSDNETFICSTMLRGNHTDTSYVSTSYEIKFRDVAPFFVDTNMNETKWKYNASITNPEHIILKCYADGLPKPMIVWEKDGIEINDSSQSKINSCNVTFLNHNQEIHFNAMDVECSGHYQCLVQNNIGWKKNHQTIEIERQNNSTNNVITENSFNDFRLTIIIVSIFVLICLSLVVCYCLSDRMRLKKKIGEVETAMRLDETQLGPLNPEEMLHKQADFLPYDSKRWEYPEEDLDFEEELGHGFFGVVMKAKAPNIHKDGTTPTVAVKKLHSYFSFSNERRALEIELRILANLEKHPNVVNLLGACTKKAAIGHLMVILEYCPSGNLLNYLRENSAKFIDQIDSLSRTIDFTKKESSGIHRFGSSNRTSRESSIENSVVMNADTENNPRNYSSDGIVPIEFRAQPRDYEEEKMYNQSIQSNASMNVYTLAPEKNVVEVNRNYVSTQNLLEWTSQIACAMEHLSGKKILHGDLAARNILLTEKRVAKICDFGLSRTIHDGHYYKRMDAVMPVKWMAIESITKRKFSSQSDVWSFGIVLWECFTLGKDPYDGLNLKELIALLNSGSRLEMPEYATQAIYDIMLRCWNLLPEDRPSFSELVQNIAEISKYSIGNNCMTDEAEPIIHPISM